MFWHKHELPLCQREKIQRRHPLTHCLATVYIIRKPSSRDSSPCFSDRTERKHKKLALCYKQTVTCCRTKHSDLLSYNKSITRKVLKKHQRVDICLVNWLKFDNSALNCTESSFFHWALFNSLCIIITKNNEQEITTFKKLKAADS